MIECAATRTFDFDFDKTSNRQFAIAVTAPYVFHPEQTFFITAKITPLSIAGGLGRFAAHSANWWPNPVLQHLVGSPLFIKLPH